MPAICVDMGIDKMTKIPFGKFNQWWHRPMFSNMFGCILPFSVVQLPHSRGRQSHCSHVDGVQNQILNFANLDSHPFIKC